MSPQEAPQPAQLPRVGAGGDVAAAVATAEMTVQVRKPWRFPRFFWGKKHGKTGKTHDKSMKTMGKTMGKSWKIDKKLGYGN